MSCYYLCDECGRLVEPIDEIDVLCEVEPGVLAIRHRHVAVDGVALSAACGDYKPKGRDDGDGR